MVLVSMGRVSQPHNYYFITAAPWFALLIAALARSIAARTVRLAVGLLVAGNVWGLGLPAVDLDQDRGWKHRRWDWYDACRLSEVARRFGGDLREVLGARAESTIVIYTDLPTGSWFQTNDGPATREVLQDPTVQAFFISDAPVHLRSDRFAIVYFDTESHHLKLAKRDPVQSGTSAALALAYGRGRAAYAWGSYCRTSDRNRFEIAYPRAVAALMTRGVVGFQRELGASGLSDSLGPLPQAMARTHFPDDPGLGLAYAKVLEHPLAPASHAACAESLASRQSTLAAIVEYRACLMLSADRPDDRLRLAEALERLEAHDQAREQFGRVLASDGRGAHVQQARDGLARLDSLEQLRSGPAPQGPAYRR